MFLCFSLLLLVTLLLVFTKLRTDILSDFLQDMLEFSAAIPPVTDHLVVMAKMLSMIMLDSIGDVLSGWCAANNANTLAYNSPHMSAVYVTPHTL